ncbi:hypothetical protein V6Z12_A08G207300 [Gossypium hirsutum]
MGFGLTAAVSYTTNNPELNTNILFCLKQKPKMKTSIAMKSKEWGSEVPMKVERKRKNGNAKELARIICRYTQNFRLRIDAISLLFCVQNNKINKYRKDVNK